MKSIDRKIITTVSIINCHFSTRMCKFTGSSFSNLRIWCFFFVIYHRKLNIFEF